MSQTIHRRQPPEPQPVYLNNAGEVGFKIGFWTFVFNYFGGRIVREIRALIGLFFILWPACGIGLIKENGNPLLLIAWFVALFFLIRFLVRTWRGTSGVTDIPLSIDMLRPDLVAVVGDAPPETTACWNSGECLLRADSGPTGVAREGPLPAHQRRTLTGSLRFEPVGRVRY